MNPFLVCLYVALILLEAHAFLFQLIDGGVDVVNLKIQDCKSRWFMIRFRIDEDALLSGLQLQSFRRFFDFESQSLTVELLRFLQIIN